MNRSQTNTGSCLCKEVTYQTQGPLRPVIGCHCRQCRKQTGHFMAATGVKLENFAMTRDSGLKWYRASDTAARGYCSECGSTLFWQADGADYIAIAAGSLDGETGVKIAGHIFCATAGDYYEITDGEFQFEESGHSVTTPE
jgi:hypothetical protein